MILFNLLVVHATVVVVFGRGGLVVIRLVFAFILTRVVLGATILLRRFIIIFLLLSRTSLRLLFIIFLNPRPFLVLFRALVLFVIFVVFVVPHSFVHDVTVFTILSHFLFEFLLLCVIVLILVLWLFDILHRAFEIVLHLDAAFVILLLTSVGFLLLLFEILHAHDLIFVFNFVGNILLAFSGTHARARLIIHHSTAGFPFSLLGRYAETFGAES